MATLVAQVKNAERMMTYARATAEGIELTFADGKKGLIPFAAISEIGDISNLASIDLPNPYEIILSNSRGETVEIPWDFARHYCDAEYRPRVEAVGKLGQETLGARLRALREATGATQEALAAAAGIGRVTLVRIEGGEQSPRYETVISLARALGCPMQELVLGTEGG
jgi:DNA-binding XRE family transcriptional regulator